MSAQYKTYISKKRLTHAGKYSHDASEVALLRTPRKTSRPSSSLMHTSPLPSYCYCYCYYHSYYHSYYYRYCYLYCYCYCECHRVAIQCYRVAIQAERREATGGDWLHVLRGFGSNGFMTGERSSKGTPGLTCRPGCLSHQIRISE